jgi:hypothetical protein
MSKFLIRSVTLLLIPCLFANTIAANSFCSPWVSQGKDVLTNTRFNTQALTATALWVLLSEQPLHASAVRIEAAREFQHLQEPSLFHSMKYLQAGLFDFSFGLLPYVVILAVVLGVWAVITWIRYKAKQEAGIQMFDKKWQRLFDAFMYVAGPIQSDHFLGRESKLSRSKVPLIRELGVPLVKYKRAVRTATENDNPHYLDFHVDKLEEWVREHDELIPYPFFDWANGKGVSEWLSAKSDEFSQKLLSRIKRVFTPVPGPPASPIRDMRSNRQPGEAA